MSNNSEPIKLTPRANCNCCRGHGTYYESHGPGLREHMACDCVFQDVPQDAETQRKIDEGNFVIVPDPSSIEMLDYSDQEEGN